MSASQSSSLRRRAALAMFTRHLTSEQCLDALWLLEDEYQNDGVHSMIAYISAVGQRFGIADEVCKSLYLEYYALIKGSADDLPKDPWPVMQRSRQEQAKPAAAPRPEPSPPPSRTEPPPLPSRPESPPPPRPQPRVATARPAPQRPARAAPLRPKAPKNAPFSNDPMTAVFNFVLIRIVHHLERDGVKFFSEMKALIDEADLSMDALAQLRKWMAAPQEYRWRANVTEDMLANIVHMVYVSLCQLQGPVDADRLMYRVLAEADALPEAKRYSPKLLC